MARCETAWPGKPTDGGPLRWAPIDRRSTPLFLSELKMLDCVLLQKKSDQRGEAKMAQGVLSYQYQEEASESGMTAWAGLPLFLDLVQAAGLWDSMTQHVRVRARRRGGWSDAQTLMSLVLLNLVGGCGVSDIQILEGDRGLGEVLHTAEAAGLTRQERRASRKKRRRQQKRRQQVRSFPSESAIFRYLAGFHDPQKEVLRHNAEKAFIPAANEHQRGLGVVNSDLVLCQNKADTIFRSIRRSGAS